MPVIVETYGLEYAGHGSIGVFEVRCDCCVRNLGRTDIAERQTGTLAELRAAGWVQQTVIPITNKESRIDDDEELLQRFEDRDLRAFDDVEKVRSGYVCSRCESLGRVIPPRFFAKTSSGHLPPYNPQVRLVIERGSRPG